MWTMVLVRQKKTRSVKRNLIVLTILQMLMSTRSPLAELNVLKKICDHPRLLSTLACEQLGLDEEARFVAQFCNPQ